MKTDTDDLIVSTLKKRFFEVAKKENIPHTPELTYEADKLTEAIRELTKSKH